MLPVIANLRKKGGGHDQKKGFGHRVHPAGVLATSVQKYAITYCTHWPSACVFFLKLSDYVIRLFLFEAIAYR
jgi:hypothetical protein